MSNDVPISSLELHVDFDSSEFDCGVKPLNKFDATNELLFTGMIWAGTDAIKIGLADAIQTTHQLEEQLKAEHKVEEVRAYNRQSKFSLKNMLTSSIEDAISNTLMKNDVVISM